jgi:trans-2,3-dihydro-3-hydroxyanthranilate isomerase
MSDHPRQVRVVDVFTEKALAGNQLAVVLDGRDMPAELMQKIAREMNFSETTFILPPDDPSHAARVRIFTPEKELPFAGHPTIGTAWVLVDEGVVESLEFVLEEGSGPVPVRGARENGSVKFWMTHPPLKFGQVFPHARVASALGINESEIVPDVPPQIAFTGLPFMFVALRSVSAVDAAVSDRARLSKLLRGKVQGVYLFATNGPGRLYSRMFAPDIPEDPATGSARRDRSADSPSGTAWSRARRRCRSSASKGRRWGGRASCTSRCRMRAEPTFRAASRSAVR